MRIELYRDRKKQWRWKFIAKNNRKIATSGEGYKNRADCIHALRLIVDGVELAFEKLLKD